MELSPYSIHDYAQVVHGSYYESKDVIMRDGLCRMKRNNIHMAIGLPDSNEVISGMRKGCEVVYDINIAKAAYSGV